MPIAYVNAGSVSTAGGGSTITVSLPASVTSGNLLILFASMSGRSFSSVTQSYTQIANRTTSPSLWVGYKFAGASETAPVLTANGTMSSGSAVIIQYSGVSALGTTGTISSATSTTLATNSITTTVADEQVISFYEGNRVAGADFTWTAPGSTTTRVNSAQTSTSNGLLIVDEVKTTAGATTARTATISISNILAAVAVSFTPSTTTTTNGDFFFMMGM